MTGALAASRLQNLYVFRLAANALNSDQVAPYDSPIAFDLERALLTEMIVTARRHGIPIVVLVIPTKLVQEVGRNDHPWSSRQLAEIERFERVRAFGKESGVEMVNAGEVIANLAQDAAKGDGAHFSKDGNALIGEALARRLEPLLRAPRGAGAGPQ